MVESGAEFVLVFVLYVGKAGISKQRTDSHEAEPCFRFPPLYLLRPSGLKGMTYIGSATFPMNLTLITAITQA